MLFLLMSLDLKHRLIVHMLGVPRAVNRLGREVENVAGVLI